MPMECPNCMCFDCERARHEQESRERMAKRCESWSWNESPLEVAREVLADQESSPEDWYRAMEEFGFGSVEIRDVRDLADQL
jgi:hypothetical protein